MSNDFREVRKACLFAGAVGLIFSMILRAAAFCPVQELQRGVSISVRDSQGNDIQLYRSSYALVIGISEYSAGWPKLRGVSKDVADVKKALAKQGFEVTVVLDAGRDKLKAAIEGFIGQYGGDPENRLVFYFAGHGHTLLTSYGEQMGYIVPADAPNPNVDKPGFKAKAIDMLLFENYAKSIDSKHALFVFDSCFSGSIFAVSRAAPEVISEKTTAPVRQFITSGSADETVPDESVFKEQFIAGIGGEADLNGDGYVTASELGLFLEDKIVNYSKGTQHPQYGKIRDPRLDKGDFVFVISPTLPKPAKKPDPDVASQIELEFWKSTKESNKPEAYQEYLRTYPQGVFRTLAQQKLDELAKGSTAKMAENAPAPTSRDAVATVNMIQLPGPQAREYIEKLHGLSVPGVPEDIKVSGHIMLVYSVTADGKVSVDPIITTGLSVTPSEKEEFVKDLIVAAAQSIVLAPPRDKSGNRVIVKNWKVTYLVSRYKDKLVLNVVNF